MNECFLKKENYSEGIKNTKNSHVSIPRINAANGEEVFNDLALVARQ